MREISPAELAEKLRAEGEATAQFFAAIPQDAWQDVLYADGEVWTVQQVLAHITQAEGSLLRLFQRIVAGGDGVVEGFDIDEANRLGLEKITGTGPAELLALFQARRGDTVGWVAKLARADLEKTGRHPFLGVTTVLEMLKLLYRHTQLHQRDIRRLQNTSD